MTSRFHTCLAATLREEGGLFQTPGGPYRRGPHSYMNHPKDPGGSTMMGVTQDVYNAWRQQKGKPFRDVRHVQDDEINVIYLEHYWTPAKASGMTPGLDLAVFDFAVHSGPVTAIRKLQVILGLKPDGHVGLKTQLALAQCDPSETIARLMEARRLYCRNLRNYPYFKNGWESRFDRIEATAMLMASGEPPPIPATPTELDDPDEPTVEPKVPIRAYDPPPQSMSQSDTGNVAAAGGAGGFAGVGLAVGRSAQNLTETGKPLTLDALLIQVISSPEFWVAFIALAAGVFVWLERRRKMLMEHI